jgi:hypothetical protein
LSCPSESDHGRRGWSVWRSAGSPGSPGSFLETASGYIQLLEKEKRLQKLLSETRTEIGELEQKFPKLRNIKGLTKGNAERTNPGESSTGKTRKKKAGSAGFRRGKAEKRKALEAEN